MIGVYFSGTGNTQYCVEQFVSIVNQDAVCFSIENSNLYSYLKNEKEIVFGYPVYFSNMPILVRDLIEKNQTLLKGKHIFIISTMGLFSGDGAGCSARIFKKQGAKIMGALHLKMPDCIGDSPLLKKSNRKNEELINRATKKIEAAGHKFIALHPTQDGLGVFSHIAGLFGQRLWFSRQTRTYQEKPVIDSQKCISCGKCVAQCPTNNLFLKNNHLESNKHCTMCYRCVNFCPTKALTILGKKVIKQVYLKKYITVQKENI